MRNPDYSYFVGWEEITWPANDIHRSQVELSTNSLEAATAYYRVLVEFARVRLALGETDKGDVRLFIENYDTSVEEETIV